MQRNVLASPVPVSNDQHGMTLTELLIVLLIISISFAFVLPAIDGFLLQQRGYYEIQQLQTLIDTSRTTAVALQSHATLCPLDSQQRCDNNWNASLTLFQDRNGNRALDTNETVIQTIPAADNDVKRHYPNRALMFDERGFAAVNNGSLSYCRRLPNNRYSTSVWIVSRMGRVRTGRDTNGDGLPEAASGQNIPCF